MITLPRKSRLALFGIAVTLGIVACEQDPISGPVDQIGPPLLDIELQPSTPVNPSASASLNAAKDTLVLTLRNLPPLPTGTVYHVLLVDSASTTAVAGAGELVVTTLQTRPLTRDSALVDTTITTSASDGTLDVWGGRNTAVLTITDADIGGNLSAYSHIVVVATDQPTTTIAADEPLGFLARSMSSGNLAFGTWSLNSSLRRPFSITGSSVNAALWGDELIANFERILRPPHGFQYVAWLIDGRTDIQYRVGGLTTPPPERRPLEDADVEIGSFMTEVALVESYLRAPADIPDNYQRLVLLLEPKGTGGAPRASTAEVFAANIPTSIGGRHPGAGRLAGKVTGGGNLDSTTVFLTGRGETTPLLANITNAAGDFLFRTVQVGDYTIHVIPRGGTTIVTSQDVTISTVTEPDGRVHGDSVFVTLNIP